MEQANWFTGPALRVLVVLVLTGCLGGDDGPCPPPPVPCNVPFGQDFYACDGCGEIWECSRGKYEEEAIWVYTALDCDCLDGDGEIDRDACPVAY